MSTFALPVSAFAASTTLLLTVLGGYGAFAGRSSEPEAEAYLALAGVASVLMIVPAVTLGLAAAAWARAVATNDLPRCDSSDPPLARSLRCALRNRVSRAWPVR